MENDPQNDQENNDQEKIEERYDAKSDQKIYLIGDVGKEYIKEGLTSEAPNKFITKFQKENTLKDEYYKYHSKTF